MLLTTDGTDLFTISGNGDVIEGEQGTAAVGSGAPYALAAARALLRHTELSAAEICREALGVAGEICIYTNDHLTLLELGGEEIGVNSPFLSATSTWTCRAIVAQLDRFIIGQEAAKRAVAIALRNRWRRMRLPEETAAEIVPNNIIMIGPTGVGKTEIARRLSQLAELPFLKVEATKFTEKGYVGRDVDSLVRDLVENGLALVRRQKEDELRGDIDSGRRGDADRPALPAAGHRGRSRARAALAPVAGEDPRSSSANACSRTARSP